MHTFIRRFKSFGTARAANEAPNSADAGHSPTMSPLATGRSSSSSSSSSDSRKVNTATKLVTFLVVLVVLPEAQGLTPNVLIGNVMDKQGRGPSSPHLSVILESGSHSTSHVVSKARPSCIHTRAHAPRRRHVRSQHHIPVSRTSPAPLLHLTRSNPCI